MTEQAKDLRKLCILNLKDSSSDDEIRAMCEQFGDLIHINRPPNKRLAFPLYRNESDAAKAKEALIGEGYRVEYANAKKADTNGETAGGHRNGSNHFRSRHSLNDSSENGGNNGIQTNEVRVDTTVAPDNRPFGICIKCGDKAYHNCGRCGDFYCSEECQSSDWLKHKRNCFPMPKLVPTKSTYSLCASHANIADSSEDISSLCDKKNVNDIDAPDGKQLIHTPPRKADNIAPVPKQFSPVTLRAVPKVDELSDEEHSVMEQPKAEKPEPPKNVKAEQSQKAEVTNDDAQSVLSSTSMASIREKIKLMQPMNASTLPRLTIPNDTEVIITYVRNHSTVYVRSDATSEFYSELITKVEHAALKAPNLTAYPFRDEIVMAPFEGGYYRAIVIKSDKPGGTVKVGFMDFGNAADVLFNDIKKLPQDLMKHPRQAVMVSLKNITKEADEAEAAAMKAHLDELCLNYTKLKISGDEPEIGSGGQVELIDLISNLSISSMFNAMVRQRYVLEDLGKNIVTDPSLPLMVIDDGQLSVNFITCVVSGEAQKFMALDETVQVYGKQCSGAPAYKPRNKELCVAKQKEEEGDVWYRCLYQQELVDDKAQVYCIDYGRIENVYSNNIRIMPSDLLFDIVSINCYIKNGEGLSTKKKMEYFASRQSFTPKSIAFNEDSHEIEVDFTA